MAPHANDDPGFATEINGTSGPTGVNRAPIFEVASPNVQYTDDDIVSKYAYRTTEVKSVGDKLVASPKSAIYDFKTHRKVGKVGMMLVGWGGNNGTTVTAGILANRSNMVWETREGPRAANYYGSILMASTVKLGTDSQTGSDVNVPLHNMLPMVHPNDLAIGGWDISGWNLAAAMDRAQVLEPTLKAQVSKQMAQMKPLPSGSFSPLIHVAGHV